MSEGNIKTALLDNVQIIKDRTKRKRLANDSSGEWRYSQAKLDEFVLAEAEILISRAPFRPNYVNRSQDLKKTTNLLSYRVNGVPTNEDATDEMREMFNADVMSYPKPSGLLKYLIRATSQKNDIVLDFFAGSATTAFGMMLQNIEDGGNRSFILVQLPEVLDAADGDQMVAAAFCNKLNKPRTIAELTKERLRRAGQKIKSDNPMFAGDLGFRVFKLASSNIKEWEPDRENLAATLVEHAVHLRTDRTEADILFELLLKLGLDLTVPIEEKKIVGKTVHSIGAGTLMVCLAEKITATEVEPLALGIADWHKAQNPSGDSTVVFRDSAFADDVAKTNLTAIFQQHGLENVRSL